MTDEQNTLALARLLRVKTAEGARLYGQPIGSVIRRDIRLLKGKKRGLPGGGALRSGISAAEAGVGKAARVGGMKKPHSIAPGKYKASPTSKAYMVVHPEGHGDFVNAKGKKTALSPEKVKANYDAGMKTKVSEPKAAAPSAPKDAPKSSAPAAKAASAPAKSAPAAKTATKSASAPKSGSSGDASKKTVAKVNPRQQLVSQARELANDPDIPKSAKAAVQKRLDEHEAKAATDAPPPKPRKKAAAPGTSGAPGVAGASKNAQGAPAPTVGSTPWIQQATAMLDDPKIPPQAKQVIAQQIDEEQKRKAQRNEPDVYSTNYRSWNVNNGLIGGGRHVNGTRWAATDIPNKAIADRVAANAGAITAAVKENSKLNAAHVRVEFNGKKMRISDVNKEWETQVDAIPDPEAPAPVRNQNKDIARQGARRANPARVSRSAQFFKSNVPDRGSASQVAKETSAQKVERLGKTSKPESAIDKIRKRAKRRTSGGS